MNIAIDWSTINFLAVAGSAVATFLIGGLWYTVLFGAQWRRLHGITEEKMKAMQARRPPPVFFGILLVCYFVLALVMAALTNIFRIYNPMDGATLGFLVWVTAATIQMTGHAASDKPIGAYLIDVSYQFIYLVMMGAILGAWK